MPRRGICSDAGADVAESVSDEFGLNWIQVDAGDGPCLDQVLASFDSIVSAVPYVFEDGRDERCRSCTRDKHTAQDVADSDIP